LLEVALGEVRRLHARIRAEHRTTDLWFHLCPRGPLGLFLYRAACDVWCWNLYENLFVTLPCGDLSIKPGQGPYVLKTEPPQTLTELGKVTCLMSSKLYSFIASGQSRLANILQSNEVRCKHCPPWHQHDQTV
jgi:hypothetical protein